MGGARLRVFSGAAVLLIVHIGKCKELQPQAAVAAAMAAAPAAAVIAASLTKRQQQQQQFVPWHALPPVPVVDVAVLSPAADPARLSQPAVPAGAPEAG